MDLTLREQAIVDLLKSDPLLSQEELAEKLGITRSSAAVHISNLMKKGVIRGKGYVFHQDASIVIFGETQIQIEITDLPENKIEINFGGFAFDAGQAFSELKSCAKIVTIIGQDQVGKYLVNKMQENCMDITNIYHNSQNRSCRTVLLNGSLICQERIALAEYEKAARVRQRLLLNADWLLIDPRLQANLLDKLLAPTEGRMPLTGTCRVAESVNDILPFYTNVSLMIIGIEDPEKFERFTREWLKSGKLQTNNYIITDGYSRLICLANNNAIDFPLMPNQGFCVRNRLTFLLAGMVYGLSRHYPLRQAIRMAVGIASADEIQ